MIGKSANPFCFRHTKTKPIEYRNNKKAWMTAEIFERWLIDLDRYYAKNGRTILLFLDNCTAHKVPNLKNIKVVFFPPNMTSHVQPMDMGIIKNLKHFYRKKVVLHLLAAQDSEKKSKIDLLTASRMLKAAWDEVTASTIKNCFAKAGFFQTVEPEIEIITAPEGWDALSNGCSYEDFLKVDENLSPFGLREVDDIVSELLNKKLRQEDSSEDEDLADSKNTDEKLPTGSEAFEFLQKTSKYIEGQENVPDFVFKAARELESYVLNSIVANKKQKKITDFFN